MSALKNYFLCLVLLLIIFVPSIYPFYTFQEYYTQFIFGGIIEFINDALFALNKKHAITSDSESMYSLVYILVILSVPLSVLISNLDKLSQKLESLVYSIIPFYLSLQLLNYGMAKISLQQFPTPNNNTLFTPLGFLDKDLAFWSTMGVSKGYNYFIGIVQILVAIMLLFRKSRLVAYIIAIGMFSNIVALNFGFDISVKLLSLILLFLSIVGLSFYFKILNKFFKKWKDNSKRRKSTYLLPILYSLSACIVVYYIISNKIKLKEITENSPLKEFVGTYEPILEDKKEPMYIFIEKEGYLILTDYQYQKKSYQLQSTGSNHFNAIRLDKETFPITLEKKKDTLILTSEFDQLKYKLNTKKLPLLQKQFHWTTGEIH